MNVTTYRMMLLLPAMASSWAFAQELGVMFVERSHAILQTGTDSSVPIGDSQFGGLSNYYFMAGAEFENGTVTNFRLAGPPWPGGIPIPFEGSLDGFELELEYSTSQLLQNAIPAGTYTFSGTGSSVGPFSESVTIGQYNPLAVRLLTNYQELNSFDPDLPLTISWQEFTEGQGPLGGLIIIEVGYNELFGDNVVWTSESITPEDALGLDPALTSVQIPAGVVTGSPDGQYWISMLFIRIDSFETLGSPSPLEGGTLAGITALELIAEIQTEPQYHPDRLYLQPGEWIQDPRLGWVYGYDADWGFASGFGYVHVAWTPHWFYQYDLGWLAPLGGDYANGIWLYSKDHGIIWTLEALKDGDFWSIQAQDYLNMLSP